MRSVLHPRLSVANCRLSLSTAGDNGPSLTKQETSSINFDCSNPLGPPGLVNRRLQKTPQITENPQLTHWHTGCNVMVVASNRIASLVE